MTNLEAFKKIKNVSLCHMSYDKDENLDGEWEYTPVEVDDGTIEYNYDEECKQIEDALKVLDIIIKYTYNGGWSGDYCTRYWDMSDTEINLMNKLFKDVPIEPLSER